MFVVKYSGPFGFIKPWTAVRDEMTFSQQFLTQSMLLGIEQKLFPELLGHNELVKIKRYRLQYQGMSIQLEQTQAVGKNIKEIRHNYRVKYIIHRGILVNPNLFLAFDSKDDAETASIQHVCLSRNEDILLPSQEILELSEDNFEKIDGYELIFGKYEDAFLVGYNRFNGASPMYGKLLIVGNPSSYFE